MSEGSITWYDDFLGVGYDFYDVHTKVLLIFKERKSLFNTWRRVIKWWPDDEIKMRFLEANDSYAFVLYGESRILIETKWVFLKALQMSEYYKRFRDEYDGAAYLGLALYRPKANSYELEIFKKYHKKVTDVQFLKENEAEQDSIVLRSRQILRDSRKPSSGFD
ncbi:MAG: hypothetical protein ACE5J2_05825 [Nitrososphaerales archaeon]